MPENTQLIAFSIFGFVALTLVIGIVAGRRVQSPADYLIAGRKLPASLVTLSLFATFFGGGTLMGVTGAAYEKGFLGVIADPFGAALCLVVATAFFFRALYRLRLLTVVDFFRVRFGAKAEVLAALCMVPPYIGWVASQFVAIGFILNVLTGLDTTLGMILGAVVVVSYTAIGGLWSVTLTDALQALVLMAGLVVLAGATLTFGSGWHGIAERVPASHFDLLPANTANDWVWYVRAWLVLGIGAIPAQDLMQRAIAARGESAAVFGGYSAAALYLLFGLIPVGLGFAALAYVPGLENPELALPRLAMEVLSPVALALVLGAFVAGILSSADSALLAPAAVLGENVLARLRPNQSDRQRLVVMRIAVIVFAILSLWLALSFREVYKLMVDSWSILLVALFVPLLAGVYWSRATERGCLAAMLGGLLAWLVFSIALPDWPADLFAAICAGPLLLVFSIMGGRTNDQ